ncbi:MAG: ComEC/Rec2 family competence protein [Candidatus Omnitrophota bacterium]
MKRPLVVVCISIICGIVAASFVSLNVWFSFACLIAAFISLFVNLEDKITFRFSLILCCFYLGYCHFLIAQILPNNHIAKITPHKGKFVSVKGLVISAPVKKKNKTIFIVKTEKIVIDNKDFPIQGNLLVNFFKKEKINDQDRITVSGTLYKPYNFPNSGRFRYREFLKRKGIYSILSVGKQGKITVEQSKQNNSIKTIILSLKSKVKQMINVHLSENAGKIMSAMILGDREDVPRFINTALQRTGTVHILAVSGLHVGIVAMIIISLLKLCQMPFRLRYLLAIIALCGFCIFTGGRVSVVRATIMTVVFLSGVLLNRDYDPYSALSLSALIILYVNPWQLFEVGFQLSFACVLSIFKFTNTILSIFPVKWKENKWLALILKSFSVSVSAWLGATGIIAYYFQLFTPIAVIANIIIVPFLFIVIASGFLMIILGGIIPGLLGPLALSCELLVALLYKINIVFLGFPGAYWEIKDISFAGVSIYYLFVVLVIGFYSRRQRFFSDMTDLTNAVG